jgi:hypothetical protein
MASIMALIAAPAAAAISIPMKSAAASCWSWPLGDGVAHDKGARMARRK